MSPIRVDNQCNRGQSRVRGSVPVFIFGDDSWVSLYSVTTREDCEDLFYIVRGPLESFAVTS